VDKLGRVLFPIAAVIVTVTAVTDQDWLRLGIAVIFLMATMRVYRKPDESAKNNVED